MNTAATTIPKTGDGVVGRLNSECARIARRPTPRLEVRPAKMRPAILQPGNRNRFFDTRTNSNRSFGGLAPRPNQCSRLSTPTGPTCEPGVPPDSRAGDRIYDCGPASSPRSCCAAGAARCRPRRWWRAKSLVRPPTHAASARRSSSPAWASVRVNVSTLAVTIGVSHVVLRDGNLEQWIEACAVGLAQRDEAPRPTAPPARRSPTRWRTDTLLDRTKSLLGMWPASARRRRSRQPALPPCVLLTLRVRAGAAALRRPTCRSRHRPVPSEYVDHWRIADSSAR
jgi:hypothetical protein